MWCGYNYEANKWKRTTKQKHTFPLRALEFILGTRMARILLQKLKCESDTTRSQRHVNATSANP